tara:strand:- start:129 stop:749 length:621 start_codon:yes stop_codon:yes gene_type:complete
MENQPEYVGGKKASEILGVHQRTLYMWDKKKQIEVKRTPGGKRMYNVRKYLKDKECNVKFCEDLEELDDEKKLKICYVRVSSHGQKDDLERQKELLYENYPKHKFIKDIGSGINFERKGLRKILEMAISGKIKELVIAHKDRLTRFGFKLIEDIIKKYSGGKIIILNKKKENEPEEELVKDVLQILNVYTAKMNGLRKYRKKKDSK